MYEAPCLVSEVHRTVSGRKNSRGENMQLQHELGTQPCSLLGSSAFLVFRSFRAVTKKKKKKKKETRWALSWLLQLFLQRIFVGM